MVSAQEAQMIALAVHELGNNAAKYGALAQPGGRVELQISKETEANGQNAASSVLHIMWRESGVKIEDGKRSAMALAPSCWTSCCHANFLVRQRQAGQVMDCCSTPACRCGRRKVSSKPHVHRLPRLATTKINCPMTELFNWQCV
jgi:hypothetical protein